MQKQSRLYIASTVIDGLYNLLRGRTATITAMPAKTGVYQYAIFNLAALLEVATQIRTVKCSCDISKRPESGSLNWVIFLLFEDGIEWVFRSPRKPYDISTETTAKLLESEVATMKFIRKATSIPVPEIFEYSSSSTNSIGIPFILMSKAPGNGLGHFVWDPPHKGFVSSQKPLPCLSRANKEKILSQLGAITAQLLSVPFNEIGSLVERDGQFQVEECLSPALIWHSRDSLGNSLSRGPFRHESEYYEALVSASDLHVKELQIEQHVFFAPIPALKEYENHPSYLAAVNRWNDFATVGDKVDNSQNRLDFCVAGHFMRDMIPSITSQAFPTLPDPSKAYAIKHPDISLSNLFVDDNFNIVCIIDWAFSSTVPISTLLIPASFPHPRDELEPSLIPSFAQGFTENFFPCKETQPNAEFWGNTRRAWLFTRLVTLDGLQDHRYFKELYQSVFTSGEDVNIAKLFKEMKGNEAFQELARTLAVDDRPKTEIEKDERAYFKMTAMGEEAVARKLSLVMGLSEGFVADKKLWGWIEDAVNAA